MSGKLELIIVSQFLHRSPDYVNLGEITSAEEAIAWHHLLSAGVPVIQTLHSGSLSAIIPRITQVFDIPKELLASSVPHLFVEVKRFWNKNLKIRKVVSIAELCVTNDQLHLQTICEFNTQNSALNWIISPSESYSIQSIQKHKKINVSEEIQKLYASFQEPE